MMEGKLIFCSDSILRFRSDYDETLSVRIGVITPVKSSELRLCGEILKANDA